MPAPELQRAVIGTTEHRKTGHRDGSWRSTSGKPTSGNHKLGGDQFSLFGDLLGKRLDSVRTESLGRLGPAMGGALGNSFTRVAAALATRRSHGTPAEPTAPADPFPAAPWYHAGRRERQRDRPVLRPATC